jgi:hypothetical protein
MMVAQSKYHKVRPKFLGKIIARDACVCRIPSVIRQSVNGFNLNPDPRASKHIPPLPPSKVEFIFNQSSMLHAPLDGSSFVTSFLCNRTMTAALQEALTLDRSILFSMLQRNRCAHGRTRYFQRMEMVLKALSRSRIETLNERMAAAKWRQQKTKREQLEWTMESLAKQDPHVTELEEILDMLTIRLPDVISRIEFAASVLFYELGRGFFMPFNTIAIGALARIRIIVMKLGRQGLVDFKSMISDSEVKTNVDLETAMIAFVEIEAEKGDDGKHAVLLKKLGIAASQSTDVKEVSEFNFESNQEANEDIHGSSGEIITMARTETLIKSESNFSKNNPTGDFGASLDFDEGESSSKSVATRPKSAAKDIIDTNQAILESLKRKRVKEEESLMKKTKPKKKKKKNSTKDVFDEIFGK